MKAQNPDQRFIQLINEHQLLIQKICRLYAYDMQGREDLFQEIVLQLWQSYPGFKGQSKFSTWLYRIAINTAITGVRKKRPLLAFFGHTELPETSQESAAENALMADLDRAITQLNEIERAIVMLYLEEKSYAEMQDILGMNEGTLKVRMSRIKEKLRQITKNN